MVRLSSYVNEPSELSADVAVSQLRGAMRSGVRYLDHGWQVLVDHLVADLVAMPGVRVEYDAAVTELPDAPAVIVASGGPAVASSLLGRSFDVGPPATASCLDLGLRRPPAHDFVLGLDVPCYFSNHSAAAALAPAGRVHVAAAQYLRQVDDPDEALLDSFVALAGVGEDDIVMRRRLHRMTTVTAIPTAGLGGVAGRPAVTATGTPDVFLAGDWVGQVGHLADATLASARAAAQAAVDRLASRRTVG